MTSPLRPSNSSSKTCDSSQCLPHKADGAQGLAQRKCSRNASGSFVTLEDLIYCHLFLNILVPARLNFLHSLENVPSLPLPQGLCTHSHCCLEHSFRLCPYGVWEMLNRRCLHCCGLKVLTCLPLPEATAHAHSLASPEICPCPALREQAAPPIHPLPNPHFNCSLQLLGH